MAEVLSWLLSEMGNIITIFVTSAVTLAGSFLFYRQKKDTLEIENESKQSDEWRKLYLDQKEDSKEKDRKIDLLNDKLNEFGLKVVRMESLLDSVGCARRGCANRLHLSMVDSPNPCIPEKFQPKTTIIKEEREEDRREEPADAETDLDAFNL